MPLTSLQFMVVFVNKISAGKIENKILGVSNQAW